MARPGFDAKYKLVYKNKGNQVASGTITFAFDDNVLDYVSSNPVISNQAADLLSWDYANLAVNETREIILIFNLNSPMETPALNAGDYLEYTANVTTVASDEVPFDNSNSIKQLVVNSLDPNDKTCLEGPMITPEMVGQYIHYVIRFENTGTFAAENIVVKDMIDTNKFDISTLRPISGSHLFVTRTTAPNKVEFIFENINLPFDDANNDGYVAFKIKTKPTLVVGDAFSNSASIYFDYNFPIVTNTATTTIQALANSDFEFEAYFAIAPNPVTEVLNIYSKADVMISSLSIYNTLGLLMLVGTGPATALDVSELASGNYYIKANTDRGVCSARFIKQ